MKRAYTVVSYVFKGCLPDYSQGPMMPKMPQMDLIAELKKRQVKPQVREGKDGALEDIITGSSLCLREAFTSCVLHISTSLTPSSSQ